jgi:hypothetical protein
MITISYGMTKSGSTLAFEFAKKILQRNGFEQRLLPVPHSEPGHNVNFVKKVTREKINDLLLEVKDNEHIVLKTHSGIDKDTQKYLEECIQKKLLNVHVVYRDPREMCLSLLDHGKKARKNGEVPFSQIIDLDDAVTSVFREIHNFKMWSQIQGSLLFEYNDLAFKSEVCILEMSEQFKINPYLKWVKDEVLHKTFTQKNKAIYRRFELELSKSEQSQLSDVFSETLAYMKSLGEQRSKTMRSKENIDLKLIHPKRILFGIHTKLKRLLGYKQYDFFIKQERKEPFVYFTGGLGDIIRTIYMTKSYQFISETKKQTIIIIASHNPYVVELFKFHKNAKNFIIIDLSHKYLEYLYQGLKGPQITHRLCFFLKLNPRQAKRGIANQTSVPEFYAPDEILSKNHVIFQPYSGLKGKDFPKDAMMKIFNLIKNTQLHIYVVGRDYIRLNKKGEHIHSAEDFSFFEGKNVTVIKNLSIPATLNLVRNAKLFLGTWSSLQQAAWFENKPVAVFYPPKYECVTQPSEYAFGLNRQDCFHSDFNTIHYENLEKWLNTYGK